MQPFRSILRRPALWLAAGSAAVAVLLVASWPREPSYAGKPLSFWLDQYPRWIFVGEGAIDFGHGERYAEAHTAVKTLGEQCLPTLVRRLRARETRLSRAGKAIREWAAWNNILRPRSAPAFELEFKRSQAALALIELDKTARPVLPELIATAEREHDPGVQAAALYVLGVLSPSDSAKVKTKLNASKIAAR